MSQSFEFYKTIFEREEEAKKCILFKNYFLKHKFFL